MFWWPICYSRVPHEQCDVYYVSLQPLTCWPTNVLGTWFSYGCLNATLNNAKLFRDNKFIGGGNRSTQRRFYHINLSSAPSTVNDQSHNLNIGIDYTGRCHSDYHAIMTTTPSNIQGGMDSKMAIHTNIIHIIVSVSSQDMDFQLSVSWSVFMFNELR